MSLRPICIWEQTGHPGEFQKLRYAELGDNEMGTVSGINQTATLGPEAEEQEGTGFVVLGAGDGTPGLKHARQRLKRLSR